MRRWDTLNDRQLELLRRIGAGEDLGGPETPHLRHSANALRDRGLITISRRTGAWHAEIGKAGRFYLDQGHHPDDPRFADDEDSTSAITPSQTTEARRTAAQPRQRSQPSSTSTARPLRRPLTTGPTPAKRRSEAVSLVELLVSDRLVVIKAPTDGDIDRWRKIVDFAKRHNLVPEGFRIEKMRQWNRDRDLHIRLVEGRHVNTAHEPAELPTVPIPATLRAPHPVVADLRDDKGRLVMPTAIRHRSLLILQAIAAEATRRGHQVNHSPVPDHQHFPRYNNWPQRAHRYSRRDGTLKILADRFNYTVTIQQTSPQSADLDKASRLLIELPYDRERPQQRWSDGKIRRLEAALPAILHDIEQRAVLDRKRRDEQERAALKRRAQWERAMTLAREKATEAHYATVLDQQLESWQHAKQLRAYRDELSHRLTNLQPTDETVSAHQWLEWITLYITRTDPAQTPPPMPNPPNLTPDDLKPYLANWSPHGPDEHVPSWQRNW